MPNTPLTRAIDELERKLRRLRNNVEGGASQDPQQIGQEIRKIMRNEVDALAKLIRRSG